MSLVPCWVWWICTVMGWEVRTWEVAVVVDVVAVAVVTAVVVFSA